MPKGLRSDFSQTSKVQRPFVGYINKKVVDPPFLFSSGLGDSQLHKGLTNTTKRHGTDVLRIIQNRLSQRDPTNN